MSPNPPQLGLVPLETRGRRRSQKSLCTEQRFRHASLRSVWCLSQCIRLPSEQAGLYRPGASLFAIVFSSSCLVNISTGKFQSCCGWTKRKSSVSTPRPDSPGKGRGPQRTGSVHSCSSSLNSGVRRGAPSEVDTGGLDNGHRSLLLSPSFCTCFFVRNHSVRWDKGLKVWEVLTKCSLA